MKKIQLLLCLGLLITSLLGCKKDSTNDNIFIINNVANIDFIGNHSYLRLDTKYYSGTQERVTLSVEGLPEGINTKWQNKDGIPNFYSQVDFEFDTSVIAGVYKGQVVGTSASMTRSYDFFATVKPYSYYFVNNKKNFGNTQFYVSSNSLNFTFNFFFVKNAANNTSDIQYAELSNIKLVEGQNKVPIGNVAGTGIAALKFSVFTASQQYNTSYATGQFAIVTKDSDKISIEIPAVKLVSSSNDSISFSGFFLNY